MPELFGPFFWQISCLQVFCAFSQLVLSPAHGSLPEEPDSASRIGAWTGPGQAGGEEQWLNRQGSSGEEPPARVDVRLS